LDCATADNYNAVKKQGSSEVGAEEARCMVVYHYWNAGQNYDTNRS